MGAEGAEEAGPDVLVAGYTLLLYFSIDPDSGQMLIDALPSSKDLESTVKSEKEERSIAILLSRMRDLEVGAKLLLRISVGKKTPGIK